MRPELYGARCSVIESVTRPDETNTVGSRNRCLCLADGCAAQGLCTRTDFRSISEIDVKQLVLQTIFLAVLLAVIVNLQPRGK